MKETKLFQISSALEVLTGLALLAAPALVVGLLLGDGMGPVGSWVGRILGAALLFLGIAAWEQAHSATHLAQRSGLCGYNLLAGSMLAIAGFTTDHSGALLWPAAILHLIVGIWMLALVVPSALRRV